MSQQQPPGYPPGYGPGYGVPQGYPPQPPPKKGMSGWMIALIIIGGITVLGLGSCVVCVGFMGAAAKHASEEQRATSTTGVSGATKQVAKPAPVVTPVDIKILLSEYKDNEVRADGEFKGKTVRVSGKVNNIKKDILSHMYVTVGTGRDFEIPEVQCTLNEENQSMASNLSKGQTITVQGEVHGLMMNVQLDDCDIVQ